MADRLHIGSVMSARRGPIFNHDDPTIMADTGLPRSQVVPAAIVRKSAVLIRTVPVVYDAADDGEVLRATELFNVPGAARSAASSPNFGGTALMPAAFSVDARAVMASMKQLEAQRPTPSASISGPRAVHPAPQRTQAAPAPPLSSGLSTFELMFGVSAAVVVGLSAALLFVYLG